MHASLPEGYPTATASLLCPSPRALLRTVAREVLRLPSALLLLPKGPPSLSAAAAAEGSAEEVPLAGVLVAGQAQLSEKSLQLLGPLLVRPLSCPWMHLATTAPCPVAARMSRAKDVSQCAPASCPSPLCMTDGSGPPCPPSRLARMPNGVRLVSNPWI